MNLVIIRITTFPLYKRLVTLSEKEINLSDVTNLPLVKVNLPSVTSSQFFCFQNIQVIRADTDMASKLEMASLLTSELYTIKICLC